MADVVPAASTQLADTVAAVPSVVAAAHALVDAQSQTDAALPGASYGPTLFAGLLCRDAERSVFRLVEEHRMQDVLNMRRVSRSWRHVVDSYRSLVSHYEDGRAVKPKLWKAWSSRWEQLRRLEMPCVDLTLLMRHGLSRATNLSHAQVYCTNAAILREFVWNLPGLQYLELPDSDFTIHANTFAHSTALHTLILEGGTGLNLRHMAAPQLLTWLDTYSANLGCISELAPRLETLTLTSNGPSAFARFSTPLRFLHSLSVDDLDEDEDVGNLLASLKFCPNLRSLHCAFELPAHLIECLGAAFQHLPYLEYLTLPCPPIDDEPEVLAAADHTWRMLCAHLTCLETLKWRRWEAKADAVELMPNLKSLRRFVQNAGDDGGALAWCFHLEAPAKFKPPRWHGCDFIPNSPALIDFLLGLEDFFLWSTYSYMEQDSPPYYWNRASLLRLLGRPAEPHLALRNTNSLFLDL